MITLKKDNDQVPVCPHCKTELTEVRFQEIKGDLGKRCLYFCPECRSCLGVSHRKGLIMGL